MPTRCCISSLSNSLRHTMEFVADETRHTTFQIHDHSISCESESGIFIATCAVEAVSALSHSGAGLPALESGFGHMTTSPLAENPHHSANESSKPHRRIAIDHPMIVRQRHRHYEPRNESRAIPNRLRLRATHAKDRHLRRIDDRREVWRPETTRTSGH